ncbi:MAG: SDR family NAD(P)-dependent oxidoreductase [Pseudomonadota bacterium]
MYQMLDPKTLTLLVTGATSGIGAATVRRFASAGSRVVAMGRRADRLEALASEFDGRIHPVVLDVRDWEATQAAVAALPEAYSAYNIVFANAGLALGLEPAHQVAMNDWRDMVDTNVTGVLNTVRATLPGMVERKQGHVVFTGSVAGEYPYPGGNTYGATKAFVKQFSLGLWSDVANAGVRVTNIEPGLTETEFSVVRFKGDEARAGTVYRDVAPMTGEDIAEQVFFACCTPRHVNITRIQAVASVQTFSGFNIRRG